MSAARDRSMEVPESVVRLGRPSLVVGVVATAALFATAFVWPEQFFRSWLVGFVFWAWITIGSIGVLSLQYLTGGTWGVLMRRPLEAAARTTPLLALLFVPLLFGLHSIYEWTHENVVAGDEILRQKAAYLNVPFFIGRTAFYLLCWTLLGWLLNRWARTWESTGSPGYALRLRSLSAGALLLLVLTGTFASVDWMMSLEPHWFSTMYGISFVVGSVLSAFAFGTVIVERLSRHEPVSRVVEPIQFRDFGNLQLAFVMLWAYTAFSQFMLIWYGNIAEETPWYLRRMEGGWGMVAGLLIVFHFFLPFTLLLMRGIKDRPRFLAMTSGLILLMRGLDAIWLIAPAFHDSLALLWLSPLAIVALGGLWLAVYFWQLGRNTALPAREPHVERMLGNEAISHG
ncbi:MAG TPA: hypothetical protein VM534_10940 [Thermoanaerobaculia bacterium]|nr:hypothetical protein [Thermoanaerobaculia bacterium]